MTMYDPVDPMTGGYDGSVLNSIQSQQAQILQSLAQFQLNYKEEIERFELLLRGCVKDEDGHLVQLHEPILNDRGRTHVMKKVRTWLTKIVSQSNFTIEIINRWCKVYWYELVMDASSYGDDWDLQQDEYASFVHDLVFSLHSIMLSAKDGGLREVVGKISKVVESISTSYPSKTNNKVVM